MSLLSSLFKSSKKVNLTPDVTPLMPVQINPKKYGELSELSSRYMQGPGFGSEFVSKVGNPQAQRIRSDFESYSLPKLSSAASARGLGRSTLALDQERRGRQESESNIDQLMADLYKVNEAQKKSDTQFGANLGQNILTGDVGQQNQIAAASERLANTTAADARTRETADKATSGNLLGAATMIGAPMLAPLGGALGGAMGSLGLGGLAQSLAPFGQALSGAATQIGTQTLSNMDSGSANKLTPSQMQQALKQMFGF